MVAAVSEQSAGICEGITMGKMMWRDIADLKHEHAQVIAACPPCPDFPNGRRIIWSAAFLLAQIERGNSTPRHLRYPATYFMPLDDLPPLPAAELTGERG